MSTRSIVAIPESDSWRGRYIHSDGSPSGNGSVLHAMVRRDGVETVRKVLTEQWCGWSCIDQDQPDITGVAPFTGKHGDPGYPDYGTAEYVATIMSKGGMYGDGRFANVPGWGIAYTVESGQIAEDDWYTPSNTQDTEWVYVLSDSEMLVLKCHWDDPPTFVTRVAYDDEPDWESIEKSA